MVTNPLVSVLCITYNHEPYIAQAIEGFLLQNTKFDIEIIIHDDASKDNTQEIIKSYQIKYPSIIKTILQKENQYSKKNGSLESIIFNMSKGKYTAICEGDDYWTDPFKLQKQVDFLEANYDYGLVHHDADYFFQKTGELVKAHHKTNFIKISNGFVFEELVKENNIYTPTTIFKTELLKHYFEIPNDDKKNFLMGDYVMWLEFSQHCKFHYMQESMATYRVLENSASKSVTYDRAIAFLNSYFDIRQFFLRRYPIKSITFADIEQWRLSSSISYAIKYNKNKDARYFASKLKIYNGRVLLKKCLVIIPPLFRYIQKKNKL